MNKILLLIVGLFISFSAYAQEDNDDAADLTEVTEEVDEMGVITSKPTISHYKMGNGLRITTPNGNHLTISGLVQTTTDTRRYEGIDDTYSRYRLRRTRLRFDGNALQDKIRFRVGLDLVKGSETDTEDGSLLQDAWIAYRPYGNNKLQVSFGQRSTPTDNLELAMSSHTLSFVERSKITSYFSTIREVGIFLETSHKVSRVGVLRPAIAITDGDGPMGTKHYGGMKYGVRINYLPFGTFRNYGGSRESDVAYEVVPKLQIGVAYSYNCGTSDRRGGRSAGDILYRNSKDRYKLPDMAKFCADAVFKYRGFSFLAEFAKTWAHVSDDITQRVRNDGTSATTFEVEGLSGNHVPEYIKNRMMLGWGLNMQAGYTLRSLWDVNARYTYVKPDKYSFMNNDLYFNRNNFMDLSVGKYLTHTYATKIQMTVGTARSKGQCRTPDSQYYHGSEFYADLMFQFKF